MSSFESLSNPNHFIQWYDDDHVDCAEGPHGVDCEVWIKNFMVSEFYTMIY